MRDENPDAFKKLIPVAGDVAEEGLGLPTIERRVLIEQVSVVFHVAASVRFDDPFKQAVFMNTRGTREVCVLATAMKKLVASILQKRVSISSFEYYLLYTNKRYRVRGEKKSAQFKTCIKL